MKKIIITFLIIFLTNITAIIFINPTYANEDKGIETIIFIRHGEKQVPITGQIDCQGMNRALRQPIVLQAKFGKPDYVFAPKPFFQFTENTFVYYYVRALMTILPTAFELGMEINTPFFFSGTKKFAAELLLPKYHNAKIFVAWEHIHIRPVIHGILDNLKLDRKTYNIPKWPHNDYDSIYAVTIDWNKSPPKFNISYLKQNLDNLSNTCPVSKGDKLKEKGIQKFVFIPEAETIDENHRILTCKGGNRSLALPKVIANLYGDVDLVLVPHPGNDEQHNYVTSMGTAEPINVYFLHLYNAPYDNLNQTIEYLDRPAFNQKTILIIYPTNEIINFARKLYAHFGGNPNEIPNNIYDHDFIYEIKVDKKNNTKPMFIHRRQNLNHVPETCPIQI